jgi:hypothetical protein
LSTATQLGVSGRTNLPGSPYVSTSCPRGVWARTGQATGGWLGLERGKVAPIAGTGFDSELAVEAATATTWRLTRPLIYTGLRGDTWVVPSGYLTDFATVPRFLHWLTLPYGAYTRAAVLHDYLLGLVSNYVSGHTPTLVVSSRDADGVFRLAMQELGVPFMKRWTMWAAVRVAALTNPRRAPGRAFRRDLWRVTLVLLGAAPLLLPGVVGVLLSLAVVWVVGAATALPDRTRRRRIRSARAASTR